MTRTNEKNEGRRVTFEQPLEIRVLTSNPSGIVRSARDAASHIERRRCDTNGFFLIALGGC
jgi:hypothetical protein